METAEKPDVFDIESVTIVHAKTVTKISKPIKQNNNQIITQQTNKINNYTGSKIAIGKLLLDLIKTYSPENCPKQHEIKIENSKMYDEQLNLKRSSINNKLFKMTNNFQELNSNKIY